MLLQLSAWCSAFYLAWSKEKTFLSWEGSLTFNLTWTQVFISYCLFTPAFKTRNSFVYTFYVWNSQHVHMWAIEKDINNQL